MSSRGTTRAGRSRMTRSAGEAACQSTPNWWAMAVSCDASTTMRAPGAGAGPSTRLAAGPALSNRSDRRTAGPPRLVIGRSVAAIAGTARTVLSRTALARRFMPITAGWSGWTASGPTS